MGQGEGQAKASSRACFFLFLSSHLAAKSRQEARKPHVTRPPAPEHRLVSVCLAHGLCVRRVGSSCRLASCVLGAAHHRLWG